jgi:hypothetical protein
MATTPAPSERSWYIAERWQQYAGESRANSLRIGAIGSFYIVHLLHHYGWLHLGATKAAMPQSTVAFHRDVTMLAVAWSMVSLVVLLFLQQKIFPSWLKYASTAADVVFLTAMLCISSGPRSPLVLGYPLVIVLAGLRFSLPLVRFATAGSLLGYLCVLGAAKWPERFGLQASDLRVPRYHQLMTLLAIGLVGLMLGQILRRMRRLAEDFVARR